MRVVIDSSVVIATLRPSERAHADALAFVERLREATAASIAQTFGPPELWLEVYVAEQRLTALREGSIPPGGALASMSVKLISPEDADTIAEFLEELTRRMRGRKPFANATDLVYVWAAHRVGGVLVTLDEGLLKYHRVMCEVVRPQHAHFG